MIFRTQDEQAMAVWNMGDFNPDGRARFAPVGRTTKAVRLTGAVMSAVLVLGMGNWAYQLAKRQMLGVPTIAAPEGSARMAPDDPGGELADHQGLSVNMIAAEGEAEATADLLVLAPKPADLNSDDNASDALQITGGSSLAPLPATPGPNVGTVQPSTTMRAMRPATGQLTEPLPESISDPVEAPDLEPIEAGSVEAALLEAGVELPAMTDNDADVEIISTDIPGVRQSPIPMAKPGAIFAARALDEAADQAEVRSVAVDVDASTLAPGTQLAQIGSYDTEAEAKQQWDSTVSRFGALFDDKTRVLQTAESGGRSFVRLRVGGFATRDEARRFCAALKSGGQCVPVQVH